MSTNASSVAPERILVLNRMYEHTEFFATAGVELVTVVGSGGPAGWHPVGRPYGREIAVADVADVQEILAALHRQGLGERFDVVYTNNEYALVAAAVLAEHFGARGMSVLSAVAGRDKVVQKRRVGGLGVPVTPFLAIERGAEVTAELVASVGFPAVVKPTGGAATRSAAKVTDVNHLRATLAVLERQEGGAFILERFVDGIELHLDGVLRDGVVEFLSVSRYLHAPLDIRSGSMLASVTFDPDAGADLYRAARGLATLVGKALGASDTVFHIEAFDTGDGLVFSECGLRTGGALIVPAIARKFDVDLYRMGFLTALGRPLDEAREPRPGSAGYVLLRTAPGVVVRIPEVADLGTLEGVLEVRLDIEVGDIVPDQRGLASHRVGHALMVAEDHQKLGKLIGQFVDRFEAETRVIPVAA